VSIEFQIKISNKIVNKMFYVIELMLVQPGKMIL
jgi:hypothetical protein